MKLVRFDRFSRWLAALPPGGKQWVISITDAVVLVSAAALALAISGEVTALQGGALLAYWLFGPIVAFAALRVLGVHRAVTRYAGIELVERCFGAGAASAASVYIGLEMFNGALPHLQMAFLFGLLAFSGALMARVSAQKLLNPSFRRRLTERVAIYGAGDAGSQLATALMGGAEFKPVCFVDDSAMRQGRTIKGLPVYGPEDLGALFGAFRVGRVLLAVPTATRAARQRILKHLEPLSVQVMVMPSLEELASGRRKVNELREVQIEDLLERDPVPPDQHLLLSSVQAKSVLVTGAGGSIGSELCRQAVRLGARRLVMLDVSEYALYAIESELRRRNPACELIPVLGSILDRSLLQRLFSAHSVQTVYHAAAYKHVPLVEANIASALINNVRGTYHLTRAAVQARVERFVLISTDKAVRPTNVMGASKRMCELIVQAYAKDQTVTRMGMVRFGNVLESSGSVVPLFREQIRAGGPVTVTHPEVTRYFMTIPEAAELVIQAGAMAESGEVYLLEMGDPVKINQLAERMIHLSGLSVRNPDTLVGDIEVQYTGLRPGEKLYEELLIADNPMTTSHPRIFKADEDVLPLDRLNQSLDALFVAADGGDDQAAISVLSTCVAGFGQARWADREFPPVPETLEVVSGTDHGQVKPRSAIATSSLPKAKLLH